MGKGSRNRNEREGFLNDNKKVAKNKKPFPVFTVSCIVAGLLLGAIIAYSVISGAGFIARSTTIMKVGDVSISALQFGYTYQNTSYQYKQILSSYMGLDENTDWANTKSSFDSTMTWQQYFIKTALDELEKTLYYYNEATSKNRVMDEDMKAALDEELANYKKYADTNKVSLDNYLSMIFGAGFGEDDFRTMYTYSSIASKYSNEIRDGYTYEDADYEDYYSENRSTFDEYTYRAWSLKWAEPADDADNSSEETSEGDAVLGTGTDGTGTEGDANDAETAISDAQAEAKAKAEAFLASIEGKTSEEFKQAAFDALTEAEQKAQAEGADPTYYEKITYGSITGSSDMKSWLADKARVDGDTSLFVDTTNKTYYVVRFTSAVRDNYNLVSFKHVVFKADLPTDDTATTDVDESKDEAKITAAWAAAKDSAEKAYKEWEATASKTSDAFTAFYEKYTTATDDTAKGLVEDAMKTSYSGEMKTWLFNAERKEGEHSLIQTSEGYEIVFFVSQNEPYWETVADNSLRNADAEEYYNGLKESLKDTLFVDADAATKHVG